MSSTSLGNGTAPNSPLPLDSRTFLVLHASVTGTAVDVAERIGRRARREGWAVTVKSVTEFNQVRQLRFLYSLRTFELIKKHESLRRNCSNTA